MRYILTTSIAVIDLGVLALIFPSLQSAMAPSLELEQETGYEVQQNVTPAQRSGLPTETSTSSYWHSEPNKFLQSHRSTPALPRDADVCIIGSGLTGSSVAQYLLNEFKFGGTVVMLEAREACWGASGRVSSSSSNIGSNEHVSSIQSVISCGLYFHCFVDIEIT